MKIVVNGYYGGFGVSKELLYRWNATHDEQMQYGFEFQSKRDNPDFVALVEELGDRANDWASRLRVVEIPDGVTDYRINDYDGLESILYVLNGKIYEA